MPTGYTYPVCEGKITEFNDFAMSCARAFGALVTMREDAMDAPIPEEIVPETSYSDRRISEDMKRMGEVQDMTAAQADAAAKAAYDEEMAGRQKYLSDKEVEAARLNAMLVKVRAWNPPTPEHTGMKVFMIQQLRDSLPGEYAPRIPELLDGKTWRQKEIDRLAESVVSHRKNRASAIELAAGRTRWVKALRASLEGEPVAA